MSCSARVVGGDGAARGVPFATTSSLTPVSLRPHLALAFLTLACRAPATGGSAGTVAGFVGSDRCGACHDSALAAWRTSQHAAAMQPATPATVSGDFTGATYTEGGVTSRFFRRDGRYVVTTIGADARPHDYDVRFTFGVAPLQQYLVEAPGGRLQPLTLAWDTRPASAGGARWFALDAVAPLHPDDDLHWTGRGMNWNYMCADCHATAVRKGYSVTADTFDTRYSELGVGCEGCHGPGSEHVRWAERPAWLRRLWRDDGIRARLDERRDVRWSIDSTTGSARRNVPRRTDREIETCAQCHARRVHIADGYVAGAPLLDYYDVQPLLPSLYHPDGQQKDEVYNYGSFLQSRMYAFGVTCADCHDPHTQKLRRPGSQVCAQCHRPAKYDAALHTGHRRGSPGGECAACHMPTTTYLEVDARHDHSIRIPRPDRTASLGVPNACAACHPTLEPAWAAAAIRRRIGRDPVGFQQFADAFTADDRASAGAAGQLRALARDPGQPAIVRASALWRLARYAGAPTRDVAAIGAADPNPLVRRGALAALGQEAPRDRLAIAAPLLGDSLRAVRQEAAWLLAALGDSLPSPALRAAFERASAEFVASQRYNADRAEHRVTLGAFLFARGDTAEAETEFRAAIRQWPRHVPAYLNLAGVLSLRGLEPEGEALLRNALQRMPGDAALHHALGLSLARQSRDADALRELARAVTLSGNDPAYVRALEAVRSRASPR